MFPAISSVLHKKFRNHVQTYIRVSVPMFDPSAKGILIKCECGKTWAL